MRSPSSSASRGTVLASMFRAVASAAEAAGLPRGELLQATGVSEAELLDPEGRVAQPAYMRLWAEIEQRVTDPFFGLHFSEAQVEAATFSVVGFAARSSDSLRQALERVSRYIHILNDTEEVTLDPTPGGLIVGQNPRGVAPPWPRHKAESAISNYVLLGRAWTGCTWSPLEVSFVHAAPRDTSEHRRIFGCPVRFDRPRNELVLHASALGLSLRGASRDLSEYLERRAEQMISVISPGTLLQDVERAVRASLLEGTPELGAIARRLGLSSRSLQRRLAEEGTTFATLVDDVRRRLSVELLSDRRVAIEEAAFLLGFADARGFRRAFERWTGRSPRAFRSGDAGVAG